MATAIHKGQNVDIFWVITVIMERGRQQNDPAMSSNRNANKTRERVLEISRQR